MDVVGSGFSLGHTRQQQQKQPSSIKPSLRKQPSASKVKIRDDEFLAQVEERRQMLERQDSSGKFKTEKDQAKVMLVRQSSQCSEFFASPTMSLMEDLRRKFDPTGRGIEENPDLYTDRALLMRESLKYDPMILKTLEELWEMVDENQNGMMDREEYKEFHHKLALVLIPSVSFRKCEELFNQDWERDTDSGRKAITKSVFGESMFELADRWTDEISAPDYINFLQGTFQALSELDPSGKRVYKSEKALMDMKFTLKPLSKLHALSLQEARARAAAEERARARAYREGREFDLEAFEAEWERMKQLGEWSESGSKRNLLQKQGSKLKRQGSELEGFSLTSQLSEDAREKRHTWTGPAPSTTAKAKGEFKSVHDKDGSDRLLLKRKLSRGKSELSKSSSSKSLTGVNKHANAQASRFYPPSQSWWARHARGKTDVNSFGPNAAPLRSQVVLGPNTHTKVGLILFDPQEKERLYRLVVCLESSTVQVCEWLDAATALEPALPNARELFPVKSLENPPGFQHTISRADWLLFCNHVEQFLQLGKGQAPHELSFVGFTSSFDYESGELANNFHFDASDVAARIPGASKRPNLGLSCPLLQSKIAKFVVQRLHQLLDVDGGPKSDYINFNPSNLRSPSALRLLSSLSQSTAVRERKNSNVINRPATFMVSISTPVPPLKPQRTLDKLWNSHHQAVGEQEDSLGEFISKRHTVGEPIQPKQRADLNSILVQRGKARFAKLGSSMLTRNASDSSLINSKLSHISL